MHTCRNEEEPNRATAVLPPEVPSQAETPSIPESTDETTQTSAPTAAWKLEVDAANWQDSSTNNEDAPTSTTQPSTGWSTPVPSTSPYSRSMRPIVRKLSYDQCTSTTEGMPNTFVTAVHHSTDSEPLNDHRTRNTRMPPTETPSSPSTTRLTQHAYTPYNRWVLAIPSLTVTPNRSRSRGSPRHRYYHVRDHADKRCRNLLSDFDRAAKTTNDGTPIPQQTTSPAAPWGRCAERYCHRSLQLIRLPGGALALHCPRGHATRGQPERNQTQTRT